VKNQCYILDACALIAALTNEPGADVVADILQQAANGTEILSNKINLLEVYYDVFRRCGKATAEQVVEEIKRSPVRIISEISDVVFAEAGRLKARYKISLADAIALAETSTSGGALVTSDHHEFDVIEKEENIVFVWIR
jgi:predicted nucleic acid-binding protein